MAVCLRLLVDFSNDGMEYFKSGTKECLEEDMRQVDRYLCLLGSGRLIKRGLIKMRMHDSD